MVIFRFFKGCILRHLWFGQLEFFYWKLSTMRLREDFIKPLILNDLSTIQKIIKEKLSVARFGDGELKMVFGIESPGFQEKNDILVDRLNQVLRSKNEKLLVCIPLPLSNLKNQNLESKYFWISFINQYQNELNRVLDGTIKFGNAGITRFYMGQNNPRHSKKIVRSLKRIWEGEDLLIIEGKYSRLGIGTDLFKNAKSISRIICPPKNAFVQIDLIFGAAKRYGKEKLILIALGPTATVLAYQLALEHYWAIDIGHVDIEYNWMRDKSTFKSPIKGRHVNEFGSVQDLALNAAENDEYEGEIIAKILCD